MIEAESLSLTVKVCVSVFAMAFYFVLLYTAAWEFGAKDKIRVDAGRAEPCMLKGAFMALIANIPNFICAVMCIVGQGVYMLTSIDAFKTVGAIFNLVIRLFMSMYLGVLQGVFAAFDNNIDMYFLLQSVGFAILPLLAVLATHVGYTFGMHNRKIFGGDKK